MFVLDHPAARAVFFTFVYGWVAAEIVLRIRNRLQGQRREFDASIFPVVVSIWLGVGLAFAAARRAPSASFDGGWRWVIVGVVLLVAGAGFRIWAIATLGRLFTYYVSIQEGHRLVESGPYRFVRHPSYTGGLVGLLGIGVCLENWAGLAAVFVFPLLGILVRIRAEEARLAAAFGDEYTSYAARHKRLLPHVW